MQRKHYKTDRYREVVSMEEEATLKRGDTVHRPYRSELTYNDLSSEGAYTRQDITDTDESLAINKEKEVSFYIREIDEMQSNYKTANEYADDAAVVLGNLIDGEVFAEAVNGASDVDDGDLGGTNDNGITLTTSNIDKIFGEANEALDALNVPQEGRKAVLSPQFFNVLWQRIGGRESMLGDEKGRDGFRGKSGVWAGFQLIKSNNLCWTGTLLIGTLPTDGDTVVINGATFTFETGTIDAAGKVKAETSAAVSIGYLVSAINAPGTTSATFQALSAANQKLVKGMTATAISGGLTLSAPGRSYIAVSETLTAAADIWTLALQIQHNFFCQGNPVDLVIQKKPNMKIKERDGYIGSDVVSWNVFGKKTFQEGTRQIVDVKVRTDAF